MILPEYDPPPAARRHSSRPAGSGNLAGLGDNRVIAMAMKPDDKTHDMRMNAAALYREEAFTDRQMGAIRRLTPVKPDGSPDPARTILFVGQTQIMTTMGTLPLSFEIEAKTLEEAASKFGEAATAAFERTVKELEEYRRQAASSIVIPERGGGGLPGGGKFQLP